MSVNISRWTSICQARSESSGANSRCLRPRLRSCTLVTWRRPTGGAWGRAGTLNQVDNVRKDVREFIRRLEAAGLTVEPTPGHYRVLREGKPLRKASGMPFMLPFSPDTIRWRRTAILELRKLGIDV
jgi:hypothetical protein